MKDNQQLRGWGKEHLQEWKWSTPYGNAEAVTKGAHVRAVLDLLKTDRILLDTETTSVDRDRTLRLVQIGSPKKSEKQCWVIDANDFHADCLIPAILESKATFICHNVLFDLLSLSLWQYGLDSGEGLYKWPMDKVARGEAFCTMVTEQLVSCNSYVRSLADLAGEQGVPNTWDDKFQDKADKLGLTEREKYAEISINEKAYLRYSAHDIFQLRAVYQSLKQLRKDPLVKTETISAVLYGIIQHRGMCIDLKKADTLATELETQRDKVTTKLLPAGIDKANSPIQVVNALKESGAKLTRTTP